MHSAIDHRIDVPGQDPVVDQVADGLRDEQIEDHLPHERQLGQHQPAPAAGVGPDGGQQPADVGGLHAAMVTAGHGARTHPRRVMPLTPMFVTTNVRDC
jgi:hypothetical protein